MARAVASQMPDRVASVITMGAPFRRISAHRSILHLSELVRAQILQRHGEDVLPDCYTSKCTCDFLESMAGTIPRRFDRRPFTQSPTGSSTGASAGPAVRPWISRFGDAPGTGVQSDRLRLGGAAVGGRPGRSRRSGAARTRPATSIVQIRGDRALPARAPSGSGSTGRAARLRDSPNEPTPAH